MTTTVLPPFSQNYVATEEIYGHTEPRIFTPPLRELTPETSYGFKVIRFAEHVLKYPLDPWQQWLVIHMGELLEDNKTPRFQKVLVIVGRQNGKTELLKVLTLYWMFVERWSEILGVSTTFAQAQKVLRQTVDLAETVPVLDALIKRVLKNTTETSVETSEGSTYYARAKGERAGRGDSLDRAVIDELRLHKDSTTYDAAMYAMSARPYSQAVFITNMGDDTSVILNNLRATAIEFIETLSGDDSLGLFEWSAPEFCDITDPQMWAMANPNLGYRLPLRTIRNEALIATTGQAEEASFRTERLCIRVKSLDAAIDPVRWEAAFLAGSLADHKSQVAFCLDVSIDSQHATLMAAAVLSDGKVRIEPVREWHGRTTTSQVLNDLPGILSKHKPRVFGWLPGGPAAALASKLRGRKDLGVKIEEISGEVADACMGFADEVRNLTVVHNDDSMVTAQVTGAEKLRQGDRWRFHRKSASGHVDAVYAAAGAVHLARQLPPRKSVRLIGPDDDGEE